jgi:two-component system NtrC family sensor kinase
MMGWIGQLRRLAQALLSHRHLALIVSGLFLLIIATASLLMYQNARLMARQLAEDFNQQQLILARQVAQQIDGILHYIGTEIDSLHRLLAAHPRFPRQEAIQASFDRIADMGVISVGVLDAGGQIITAPGGAADTSVTAESVIADCACEEPGVVSVGPLRVHEDVADSPRVVGMLCMLVSDGPLAGSVLFARFDVPRLIGSVAHDVQSGQTGYPWVIDDQGMFLYHPRESFIGQNAFTVRHEQKPDMAFSQINRIMRERMVSGQEGVGTYDSAWHRTIRDRRITKLIGYAPVTSVLLRADKQWSVAVAAPISEVAGPVHRMYVRHFAVEAALIGGLFVFGVLAVTYQQRISRALQAEVSERERYLSMVLSNSADAIVFVDNANRVQAWNKGAELIFGYTAEEMVGQTFHRLIPPEMDAEGELRSIAEEVHAKGHMRNYVCHRMTKDGRRITVDLSRTLVRTDDGKVHGSTAIIKDVTEKMELEQRIYNTEKLASIGTLAAGVAHEINNPLTVILGFADLLLEQFPPGSPEHDDLKTIEENANNARKIVQNLLGFARITEGLEETVDIKHSLETVTTIVSNTLMTKKVELVTDIAPGLPTIRGDAREFQQVVFNLINNSVAAMGEGGGKLIIGARQTGDRIQVTVSDTGPGIPDRIKPQVFDPFFTTKKVGEGTGLGLSLCYGIIKKYGGTINFVSVAQEDHPDRPSGTVFTVSMPVQQFPEPATGERT